MKKYIITTSIALLSFISIAGAQDYQFSKDLSVGAVGADVTALQEWLISSGYDIPAISMGQANKGYFGSQTRQALMKYQFSQGIPNTGYFGPMTRGRVHEGYRGSSLVVTSPNGGEVWKKGTVQNIIWKTSYGLLNQTADIRLAFPTPACAKPGANPVCMVKMRAPYTIARGISLSNGSYSWNVGTVQSSDGITSQSSLQAEDGNYTIQICPTNGSSCDESNNEFTITSGDATSKAPVINGIDAPTTLNINQTGTWTVRATDPQNGSLTYSVDWGDMMKYGMPLCPQGYSCQESAPSVQQTSSFTHVYSVAGTYNVTFTVKNSSGLSVQSGVTVIVRSNTVGSFGITSPNGNETWVKGTQQNITWTAPAYFRATYADIWLVPYVICPTGMMCEELPPKVIANNININQNLYNWRVGEYYDASDNNPNAGIKAPISDGQYTIKICEVGTNRCDSSDKPFTINSPQNQTPTVKVTSPNGGEVWKANSTQQIAWYLNGAYGNAKVDLYLHQAGVNCIAMEGAVCDIKTYILDKNIPASSIYNWIVATDINNVTIPPGNYVVRVCTAGATTNCDTSNNWFTISQ